MDKESMTLNEIFGNKSAASGFGDEARRLTEDELFTVASFLLPGGRGRALKKALSKGGTRIKDILMEFIGKGKPMSGQVPVAKDPFRLLPKKQDPGLTMRDILERNERAMAVPAYMRQDLGLTKRVRVPGRKENVETGAKSVNDILRLEAPKTGSEMLPSIPRQMVPRTRQQRQQAFTDDLVNRVYGPSQRAQIEIDKNRNMIKNIGKALGKPNKEGVPEVSVEDLIKFLSGKN